MRRGKIWGWTEQLFNHNNVECHIIYVKQGFSCSMHKHNARKNAFYILEGTLAVQVEKSDYNLTDTTFLEAGQQSYVPVGENHRFVGMTDVKALEWYWVDMSRDDIERKNVGYSLDPEEFVKIQDLYKSLTSP